MAHRQLLAPNDSDIGNVLPVFIKGLHSGDNVVHMFLAKLAAVHGETNHVAHLGLLFGSLQVIFHRVVAQLRSAYPIAADQFKRKALTGKGLMAAFAVKELIHIDVHTVAASRQDHTLNASVIEPL